MKSHAFDRYNNLENIREVKSKQLPGGLVSIGGIDTSVPDSIEVGLVFNGVVVVNVVCSTTKIDKLICKYHNECLYVIGI